MEAYVETRPWRLYLDGSWHKDEAGVGILILLPKNILSNFRYKIKESYSNNEVEYEALLKGPQSLLDLGARDIETKGDSELLV